jgi:hypothetical protein
VASAMSVAAVAASPFPAPLRASATASRCKLHAQEHKTVAPLLAWVALARPDFATKTMQTARAMPTAVRTAATAVVVADQQLRAGRAASLASRAAGSLAVEAAQGTAAIAALAPAGSATACVPKAQIAAQARACLTRTAYNVARPHVLRPMQNANSQATVAAGPAQGSQADAPQLA